MTGNPWLKLCGRVDDQVSCADERDRTEHENEQTGWQNTGAVIQSSAKTGVKPKMGSPRLKRMGGCIFTRDFWLARAHEPSRNTFRLFVRG